ncbi:MAG: ACP S-malonyltransferase, partial [Acidobacteriaceae bacterium]|nr:ACP S-malonyltransferase [Acidobacteriaceae bacterium]
MAAELQAISFEDLRAPLVNNWQAREITTGAEARQGLFEQIPRPVLWTDTIRYLAQKGVKRFIEVGPGGVLTGLCRSIEPSLPGARFGEPSDWEKVKALL